MAGRKIDLAYRIAAEQGLPLPAAQIIVNAVLDEIVDAVVAEGRLELREFGVFRVHERKAMIGRNPRTGEAVALPRRKFVTFRMGRVMRERFETGSTTMPVASRRTRKHQDPAP